MLCNLVVHVCNSHRENEGYRRSSFSSRRYVTEIKTIRGCVEAVLKNRTAENSRRDDDRYFEYGVRHHYYGSRMRHKEMAINNHKVNGLR